MIPQSIIFDTMPESAVIEGREYRIRPGYRTMMAIEAMMFSDMSDDERLLRTFGLFFEEIPENMEKAVDFLLWFHKGGEEEDEKKKNGCMPTSPQRAYDFFADAEMIYAAFRQQYGIDLRRTANADLHWWEFRAMFFSLSEDVKMAKVMYWRTCELKGMPKSEKKFIEKMRALYALKSPGETMDSKTKLARRNAEMKRYIARRMEECRIRK